jgi:hypothetical protein
MVADMGKDSIKNARPSTGYYILHRINFIYKAYGFLLKSADVPWHQVGACCWDVGIDNNNNLICVKNRRGIKGSGIYANTSLQPTAAPQEHFSPRSSLLASMISARLNEATVFESVWEGTMRRKLHTMLI